jgi:hypothetical protein
LRILFSTFLNLSLSLRLFLALFSRHVIGINFNKINWVMKKNWSRWQAFLYLFLPYFCIIIIECNIPVNKKNLEILFIFIDIYNIISTFYRNKWRLKIYQSMLHIAWIFAIVLKILMIFVVNLRKRGLTIYSSHINS